MAPCCLRINHVYVTYKELLGFDRGSLQRVIVVEARALLLSK